MGKRLPLRLLSDAMTGEWREGEAGERQGSEPREPGGLRHQAGGVFCGIPWGRYHLARRGGTPGPKGV